MKRQERTKQEGSMTPPAMLKVLRICPACFLERSPQSKDKEASTKTGYDIESWACERLLPSLRSGALDGDRLLAYDAYIVGPVFVRERGMILIPGTYFEFMNQPSDEAGFASMLMRILSRPKKLVLLLVPVKDLKITDKGTPVYHEMTVRTALTMAKWLTGVECPGSLPFSEPVGTPPWLTPLLLSKRSCFVFNAVDAAARTTLRILARYTDTNECAAFGVRSLKGTIVVAPTDTAEFNSETLPALLEFAGSILNGPPITDMAYEPQLPTEPAFVLGPPTERVPVPGPPKAVDSSQRGGATDNGKPAEKVTLEWTGHGFTLGSKLLEFGRSQNALVLLQILSNRRNAGRYVSGNEFTDPNRKTRVSNPSAAAKTLRKVLQKAGFAPDEYLETSNRNGYKWKGGPAG